jgi:hypothetical protein
VEDGRIARVREVQVPMKTVAGIPSSEVTVSASVLVLAAVGSYIGFESVLRGLFQQLRSGS